MQPSGLEPPRVSGEANGRALDRLNRTIRWIALAVLALFATSALGDAFMLVFAAIVLAVLLRGASERLGRATGVAPRWALGAITLGAVVLIAAVGWWRGPQLAAEVQRLAGDLAGQLRELWRSIGQTGWGGAVLERARGYVAGAGGDMAGRLAGIAGSTLGGLGTLIVMLATAFYLAIAPSLYVEGSLRLLPPRWRARGRDVLGQCAHTLRWWFLGQSIDMVMVGLASWAGLMLLGVPLAGSLALVAALLNFVPYIGAIAGAVPAVLIAAGQGPEQALWVALLFTAIQAVEGNLIAPIVQRRTVDLPPVVTILAQTVFGTLFGPVGLILATPLAAAGLVVIRMVYVEDVLGDRER